jgi:hypothetical protein
VDSFLLFLTRAGVLGATPPHGRETTKGQRMTETAGLYLIDETAEIPPHPLAHLTPQQGMVHHVCNRIAKDLDRGKNLSEQLTATLLRRWTRE